MKRLTVVATVTLLLALPGTASADSGLIVNVRSLSDGQVQATYMSSSSYCGQFDICGWFPYATQAPLGEGCNPHISRIVYVGNYLENRASQTGTEAFFPEFPGSFKICLHLDQADGRKVTVAERIITRSPAPPPPTPVTLPPAVIQQAPATSSAPEPVLLTRTQAERTAKRGLRKRFGQHYRSASSGWMRCNRTSRRRFVCRVAWNLWPRRVGYRGTVTVWLGASGPAAQIRVRKRAW